MKSLKVSISGVLLAIITVMYGCGGNSQEHSSSASSSGSSAPVAQENVSVDPDLKSDSKGVGRFTSVEVGPIDKSVAEKGEAIFASKCAACHKTSEEKVVGPGLKNITQRREPEWIMNMITNPEEMTKSDPVAKALFEKHLIQMTFQNVSDDESRAILEFLRANDSK
jgi:cytochrome c551/c552